MARREGRQPEESVQCQGWRAGGWKRSPGHRRQEGPTLERFQKAGGKAGARKTGKKEIRDRKMQQNIPVKVRSWEDLEWS